MRNISMLGLLFVGMGCGDSGGGELTPTSFFQQGASIACKKIFECEPQGNQFIQTEAQCVAFIGGLAGEQVQSAFDQGWIDFDGAEANGCLSVLRTAARQLSCENAQDGPEIDCSSAIIPLQDAMAPCGEKTEDRGTLNYDYVCKDGLVCDRLPDQEIPVCIPAAAIGEACGTPQTPCDKNAYCARADGESTCQALTPIGEACTDWQECGDDAECSDAGVCEAW